MTTTRPPIVHPESPCTTPGCPNVTTALDVFPGGICLDCYRPHGEALHRTMTAGKLARMWGAR
jgi:hypothetical protein